MQKWLFSMSFYGLYLLPQVLVLWILLTCAACRSLKAITASQGRGQVVITPWLLDIDTFIDYDFLNTGNGMNNVTSTLKMCFNSWKTLMTSRPRLVDFISSATSQWGKECGFKKQSDLLSGHICIDTLVLPFTFKLVHPIWEVWKFGDLPGPYFLMCDQKPVAVWCWIWSPR